ncbi:hypothetical protein C8Q74DRAFT_1356065 [Fomes fomentarius]|nr:hypothetical protein C8Q74DRAFT_1356065 [Fomes fomentarius]
MSQLPPRRQSERRERISADVAPVVATWTATAPRNGNVRNNPGATATRMFARFFCLPEPCNSDRPKLERVASPHRLAEVSPHVSHHRDCSVLYRTRRSLPCHHGESFARRLARVSQGPPSSSRGKVRAPRCLPSCERARTIQRWRRCPRL